MSVAPWRKRDRLARAFRKRIPSEMPRRVSPAEQLILNRLTSRQIRDWIRAGRPELGRAPAAKARRGRKRPVA